MKRLCKSNTDKKVCGVCGGIAEYLNTDSTLIRLAFLVVCAMAGSGILAYFIAAIVMPDAGSVQQEEAREEKEAAQVGEPEE